MLLFIQRSESIPINSLYRINNNIQHISYRFTRYRLGINNKHIFKFQLCMQHLVSYQYGALFGEHTSKSDFFQFLSILSVIFLYFHFVLASRSKIIFKLILLISNRSLPIYFIAMYDLNQQLLLLNFHPLLYVVKIAILNTF